MDSPNQNQASTEQEQPKIVQVAKSSSPHIKPRVAVLSTSVLVLIVALGWLYINNQKSKIPSPTENNLAEMPNLENDSFNVPTTRFTDAELGIAFDYPKAWGETITSVKADSRSLAKRVTFTNQPDLYFEIASPAPRSDAQNLQIQSGFGADLSRYCKQNILEDRSEPLSDVYDMYRLNGSDEFGVCPNDRGNIAAIVYRTAKRVDLGTPPLNEVGPTKDLDKTTGISTLKFSKRYYLRTQNPLYYPLIVYQSVTPDVKSQNYCYSLFGPHVGDTTRYLKTYGCISYKDKPLIDTAFADFSNSEFNKQTELVLKGMKINGVSLESARQHFSNHFIDLVKYQGISYSYLYPKIMVQNQLDRETKFNVVGVITRESVVRSDKDYAGCEGPCFPPTLTTEGWDNEKNLLENNHVDGSVACVAGVHGNSLCEIKTFGKNKFLIRYTGRGGGDSVVMKTYIIYKNGARYEITSPELESQGADPAFFKRVENQFIQKIYEDIVKSFTLL